MGRANEEMDEEMDAGVWKSRSGKRIDKVPGGR